MCHGLRIGRVVLGVTNDPLVNDIVFYTFPNQTMKPSLLVACVGILSFKPSAVEDRLVRA